MHKTAHELGRIEILLVRIQLGLQAEMLTHISAQNATYNRGANLRIPIQFLVRHIKLEAAIKSYTSFGSEDKKLQSGRISNSNVLAQWKFSKTLLSL